MKLAPGARLGPYEILAPLGAGAMGEVYSAHDTRLGRTVAVKILPAEFAEDVKLTTRFEAEAKAISALSHPNICALYDVGPGYLVMEYCEGKTLARRIEQGALPIEQVIEYGIQIAGALDTAHRAGIVHRDLKPSNIMVTRSGLKLLDFGLAKQRAESSPDESTVDVSLGPKPRLGKPRMLFEGDYEDGFDVTRDGLRFVMIRTEKQAPAVQLNVIIGMFDNLRP